MFNLTVNELDTLGWIIVAILSLILFAGAVWLTVVDQRIRIKKSIKLDTSVDESVPEFANEHEEKEWLDKQKERDNNENNSSVNDVD